MHSCRNCAICKKDGYSATAGCSGCQYPAAYYAVAGGPWLSTLFQHPGCGCNLAVWCIPFGGRLFFSEAEVARLVESRRRFDAARVHLLGDVAEVPVHHVFHNFKQRFMKFSAHFGYTRPHPFPADGDVVGDPPPPDALLGVGAPCPPPSCTRAFCGTACTTEPCGSYCGW